MATRIHYDAASWMVLVNASDQLWNTNSSSWVAAEVSGNFDSDTVIALSAGGAGYVASVPSGAEATWEMAAIFETATPAYDAMPMAQAAANRADLVSVGGSNDNYGRSWTLSLSEIWAGLIGNSTGSVSSTQVYQHADATTAFTMSTALDGDRTRS